MPFLRTASASASSETETVVHHDDVEAPRLNKEGKEGQVVNHVGFEEGSKENPRNWSTGYKIWITFELGLMAFDGSLGTSIISPANNTIAKYVNISDELANLTIALYLVGFAIGPILWAPISELWGRKISLIPAMFCLAIFSIGTAVSTNTAAIFITRFFGGVFASAPVSNVSAAMGDLYEPEARGTAIAFYALCAVGAPTIGPIMGAALNEKLSWRWTEYIEAIFTGFVVIVTFFCLPETYAPVLLKRKAQKLRKETQDSTHFHPHEHAKLDLGHFIVTYFLRPIRMLFTEPTEAVIAMYASFVYSLLYMSLGWVPIVFGSIRGWSPVVSTLPFLSLFIGICCALVLNLGNQRHYHRASQKAGGKAVPEARLPPIMIASVFFCAGLFWFGWTALPSFHWINPCIALAFIGLGFNSIFQQCINILIDTYPKYAASAVSGNTILRSIMAAGLSMATLPMYHGIGVGKSFSILGAVAAAAIPVPFLLLKYGATLRRRSSYATE